MLVLLALATVIYLLWFPKTSVKDVTSRIFHSSPTQPPPHSPGTPVTLRSRKVLGLTPGKESEEVKDLVVRNVVSPKWEDGLRKSLSLQGGNSLKSISVQKNESLIWVQDGGALNVESVTVKLKDFSDRETSFRAMVDSSNGKIIQTWDQPIIDDYHRNEESGIKLDPRYHSD